MMSSERSKLALVLAGGGLAVAVYEIGALRAIDDLLVDRIVNEFYIYVGTSAGALVASALANGLTPETILATIEGSHPDIRPVKRSDVFQFNAAEFLRKSLALPHTLLGAWSYYLRHLDDMTVVNLLWSLSEALLSALYDGEALERYVCQVLSTPGCCDSFADLARDLYVIATDLDTGERPVFGPTEHSDVSISRAVAASSALPLIYKPVRSGENEYVDSGLRGTASLDLAIEQGAKLVIYINPLVPYVNRSRDSIPFLGPNGSYLSEKGAQSIASQVTRIFSHAGLHYHVKQLRRQHPDVDIILTESRADDHELFFHNPLRYSTRLTVARYGFESVTLDLAEDYPRYRSILARHGIPPTRRLVITELAQIRKSGYDPEVIRRVLEARSVQCNRMGRDTPICRLTKALAELNLALGATEALSN